MNKFKMLIITMLAFIALVAAGCGDDDSGDGGGDPETTEATDDGGSEDGESEDSEDGESEDSMEDDDDADHEDGESEDAMGEDDDAMGEDESAMGEDDVVPGDEIFAACAGDFSALRTFGSGAIAGIDPSNPDLEASMKALIAQIDEMAGAAPSEIEADFEVMSDAMHKFDEVMSAIDYDFLKAATDPEAAAKLGELDTVFDDAAIEEAGNNIEAWFEENCEAVTE